MYPDDKRVPLLPGLLQCRLEATLSQRQLADLAGVARPTIAKLEQGKRTARVSTLRKLAAALKREPRELMAGPNDPALTTL